MKRRIVGFILGFGIGFGAVSGSGAQSFDVPPAAVASEELRGIRDKLLTTLFFRGELADSIMDHGLQNKLIRLSGSESRSEVRSALMAWIKNNPDAAANLYFYLQGSHDQAGPPETIKYAMPTWEIQKNFLALAQGVERGAKNTNLSAEEAELIVRRLYDRPHARPEEPAPVMPDSPGEGIQGAGRAEDIRYADYKLNSAGVERESQALNGWFERVKSFMGEVLREGTEKKDLERSRRLFDETFDRYRSFILAVSDIKGRAVLTELEAGRLEAVRRELRKNLSKLEAFLVTRRMNGLAAAVPSSAPGSKAMKDEAAHLEEAFNTFLSGLENAPENIKTSASRLYELENAVDFWTLRYLVYSRLLKLKDRIENRNFSCVLDLIMFQYLSRRHPSSDYVRLAGAVSGHIKAIDASLEGLAGGDYETAASFAGGGRTLMEKIAEIEAEAGRLESYSRFNRRLQFVFWDVLANPFGFEPAPKGLTANNILF